MAVAFDAASESHTGTTGSTSAASFTWNHVPAGSPRGALVFVFSIGALTDTSVTYGGVSMTAVPYTAADTDTELGSVRAYYLDNCGTGTKAVVVNRTNNAIAMYAVCFTVTATFTSEVYAAGVQTKSGSTATATGASSTGTGTGTLALLSVTDGSPGTNSLRFMGRYQGTSNVTAAGSGSTAGPSIDFGLFVIDTFYETTAGQGARNVGGATITDDVAAIALAVREIPAPALVGTSAGVATVPAANLTTAIRLVGTSAGAATVPAANLTTGIALTGSSAGVATVPAANLTTAIRLVGTSAGVATVPAANLTTGIALTGSSAGTGAVPGTTLTTAIRLTGTAAGIATVQGALAGGAAALVGTAAGVAAASANLTTAIQMAGSSSGVASVTADLLTVIALAGSSGGVSSAAADLATAIALAGTSAGAGTAAGILTDQATAPGLAALIRMAPASAGLAAIESAPTMSVAAISDAPVITSARFIP